MRCRRCGTIGCGWTGWLTRCSTRRPWARTRRTPPPGSPATGRRRPSRAARHPGAGPSPDYPRPGTSPSPPADPGGRGHARVFDGRDAPAGRTRVRPAGPSHRLPARPVVRRGALVTTLFGRRHMPPFDGATAWLNTEPLDPAGLREKIVLVDFWT